MGFSGFQWVLEGFTGFYKSRSQVSLLYLVLSVS